MDFLAGVLLNLAVILGITAVEKAAQSSAPEHIERIPERPESANASATATVGETPIAPAAASGVD